MLLVCASLGHLTPNGQDQADRSNGGAKACRAIGGLAMYRFVIRRWICSSRWRSLRVYSVPIPSRAFQTNRNEASKRLKKKCDGMMRAN